MSDEIKGDLILGNEVIKSSLAPLSVFFLGKSGDVILRINEDGTIEIGEWLKPDEAGR